MSSVSVVIPCLNLESKIAHVISLCKEDYEVVVVDDGSDDATGAVAKKAGARVVTHSQNMGKGAAMRSGARAATGDVVVFIDGDLQHDPKDIPRLVEPIDSRGCDIVIGARRIAFGRHMPVQRWLSNSITSGLIRLTSRIPVHDSQSGFRATRREKFLALDLKSTRYEIETEWLVKAAKDKQRICEVTIGVVYNDSESHFSVRDVLNFLRIIIFRRR